MALVVGNETYKRFIVDPENDERHDVTFRPLSAKHKAELEDMIQMEYGAETAHLRPGSMRKLQVFLAVVKWDAPIPWTEAILDQLQPSIYEQIYSWISWGVKPPEQDQETGLPLFDQEPKPVNRAAARRTAPKKTAPKREKSAAVAS